MEDNYALLVSRINEFTRKFYLNKLLRGLIYTISLLGALYLIAFTATWSIQPSVATKTVFFFSLLAILAFGLTFWILKPAAALFKLSKNISIEEAAQLIGAHFFTVKDKLVNTLQLKALADQSPGNNLLILAGIDQKIAELKPIPFTRAIQLQDNKKYIRYIFIPLSIILLIALLAPAVLRDGTHSFVQYNREILPAAPFDFVLKNENTPVVQGDDLNLNLELKGNELPQEVYVTEGLNTYKLEKENISHFHYTFKNIQKDKVFRFSAGGFNSKSYEIQVKARPAITNVSAEFRYPAYLQKKNEIRQNVSDLLIPEGTVVTWKVHTANSNELLFILDQKANMLKVNGDESTFSARVRKNSSYQISPKNNILVQSDSLVHQINVVADQYPTISIGQSADSLSSKALYFNGAIADDHGFSSLKFCYTLQQDGGPAVTYTKTIAYGKNQLQHSFFYFWDLNTVSLKPGQALTYYFEVADNDGVNGAKKVRSEIKTYQALSTKQVAEKMEESATALKNKMEYTIKLASALEKESKKLAEGLLDKKQITFEDKKQIEQLLQKQRDLQEAVNDIKKRNEKNTFDKQENKQLKDELAEKQKQIDQLFDNALDEKTKALLQKLQALMDKNNKDQTQQELSNMQSDNKSLKKELDRILELYKQLEFEQNLQDKTTRLNELAAEQKALAKQTAADKSAEPKALKSLQEAQNKLTEQFNGLKKEIEDLAEKNQQLERPNAFENPAQETEKIQQQQKDSEQQLSKKDKSKAAESQEKAAEQMEQLADKMNQEQQEGEEKETDLNARELRHLLENLLKVSFEQEKVMLALRKMNSNDPSFTPNVQKQRGIKDNMKTVADSLFSLSKRVPEIEKTVNDEMEKIRFNIDKSLEELGERQISLAARNQQYTMTAVNNLALMLNETLEQLQNAQKNAKSGKGKGKKQSMQQLQQMQQQLNKAMQQAKDKMQKEGNKGSAPKGTMGQEFAKMAQEQQMIREALQKINREDNKNGTGKMGNLNQTIQDMKTTEMELVNKKIEQATLNRQKELLTKLLEAEKAEQEQEQDGKRESKSGKAFPPSYQKKITEFKNQRQNETEFLQKLQLNLNDYYKNRITEYFKLLNSAP
ncbi:hypothetical protein LPB86_03620 [Pedobacter sp. MC2016-14]|uniref:DUF4175 family protein n=1 Tax=Pedobacter sp. MC2016-14 TaxID=2897327 RepID=UPI001E467C77|nr:DUF4175 family protein [Pedobacter sp. MC2016-14]MCD0487302.1 hypothetical protein [Pedobacter sp. MC2016-14]